MQTTWIFWETLKQKVILCKTQHFVTIQTMANQCSQLSTRLLFCNNKPVWMYDGRKPLKQRFHFQVHNDWVKPDFFLSFTNKFSYIQNKVQKVIPGFWVCYAAILIVSMGRCDFIFFFFLISLPESWGHIKQGRARQAGITDKQWLRICSFSQQLWGCNSTVHSTAFRVPFWLLAVCCRKPFQLVLLV